ncbi:MAG TPA: hypothetical protein VF737_05685 [Gemmatimonadaceae bacterium]
MATHRPFQLSLLALAFLGVSIAAFEYARRMIVDPSQLVQLNIPPRTVIDLVGVVGVVAAGVAVAAWIRSKWLPWLIGIWGLCAGALMYEFQSRAGSQGEPVWMLVFPYVMLLILTWLLVTFGAGQV